MSDYGFYSFDAPLHNIDVNSSAVHSDYPALENILYGSGSTNHESFVDFSGHGQTNSANCLSSDILYQTWMLQRVANSAPFPGDHAVPQLGPPALPARGFKRRHTANRKERRRTQSINNAFSALRQVIPNVPTDTKLSKIKTLRLACSYISFLMDALHSPDKDHTTFKAEIKKVESKEEKKKRELEEIQRYEKDVLKTDKVHREKTTKGRTGWPEAVWASELK